MPLMTIARTPRLTSGTSTPIYENSVVCATTAPESWGNNVLTGRCEDPLLGFLGNRIRHADRFITNETVAGRKTGDDQPEISGSLSIPAYRRVAGSPSISFFSRARIASVPQA